MLELVRKHRAEDRVTIASFHTSTALAVRRRGYAGETALSQGEVATLLGLPALLWRQLPFTGTAAQVPTRQGPIRFDRATFIAKCHNLGLRVDFWTIDDPAEAKRLLDLGADGIITNDPAALKPLFS
jgi:glycerophosphoryl diester phosphodiesterase